MNLNNRFLPLSIIQRLEINFKTLNHILPPFFIAGGAVADVIYSIIKNIKIPIRDIDVFYLYDKEYNDNVGVHENYVGVNLGFIKEYKKNKYNFVKVQSTQTNEENDICYNIISQFDLNCCEVGISFPEFKLIYTNNFERFLNTRRIEITNENNVKYFPSTIMRLYNKCLKYKLPIDSKEIIRAKHVLNDTILDGISPIVSYEKFKEKSKKIFKEINGDFFISPDQDNNMVFLPKNFDKKETNDVISRADVIKFSSTNMFLARADIIEKNYSLANDEKLIL